MLALQLQNANAKRSPYFLELRHNILFPDLERLIDVTDLNTELFMMLMIFPHECHIIEKFIKALEFFLELLIHLQIHKKFTLKGIIYAEGAEAIHLCLDILHFLPCILIQIQRCNNDTRGIALCICAGAVRGFLLLLCGME